MSDTPPLPATRESTPEFESEEEEDAKAQLHEESVKKTIVKPPDSLSCAYQHC